MKAVDSVITKIPSVHYDSPRLKFYGVSFFWKAFVFIISRTHGYLGLSECTIKENAFTTSDKK